MLLLPFLIALAGPTVELDVVYASVGKEELRVDIYRPAPSRMRTAAVILVHGGAWISGSRREMAGLGQSLAKEGVAAFAIQYRLAPKAHWPAMLDDAQTAVRFVRERSAAYNVDRTRIGAAGLSAGGQIALMLGFTDTASRRVSPYGSQSSKVSAVLDIFGPTDLSLFPENTTNDFITEMVLGKKRADARQEIFNASPIQFVRRGVSPIFIIQGLSDPLVSPEHSRLLEQKCLDQQVPVEARYIPNMGHSLSGDDPAVKRAYREGVDWLIGRLSI